MMYKDYEEQEQEYSGSFDRQDLQMRLQDQEQGLYDQEQMYKEVDIQEQAQFQYDDQLYKHHTSFIYQESEPLQQQSRQVRTMTQRTANETKNISKALGNYFSKYIRKYNYNEVNQVLKEFADNKVKGQQSKFNIHKFGKLHKDPYAKQVLQFYLFDQAYIDMLNSKQIDNQKVIDYIDFIEYKYASADVEGGVTRNLHKFVTPNEQFQ